MINYEDDLIKIFKEDKDELLNTPNRPTVVSKDKQLVESFIEINSFFKTQNREPISGENISERKLAARLAQIKTDKELIKTLKPFDEYNLLGEIKEIETIEDIFENDSSNILDISDEEELFDIKNFKLEKNRTDFVARRRTCKDFKKFRPMFETIHKDLKEQKRKLLEFTEKDLNQGRFFILEGIMVYVDKVDLFTREFQDKTQGTRKRQDSRIRCIFENGLESNMFFRSLQKLLYKDGKRISETNEEALEIFEKNLGSSKDFTGYIYVLRSLSQKPEIKKIPNFYKIGFSTNIVGERIKNCENEPTFLNDKIEIMSETPIYGYAANKIENIIQSFFAAKRLDIEIADKNGYLVKPKEWFSVSLDIIHQSIKLLSENKLKDFVYDGQNDQIQKETNTLL
jgi:hypothetical protein